MSIIEKAMKRLNGSTAQRQRRPDEPPKVVDHPAAAKASWSAQLPTHKTTTPTAAEQKSTLQPARARLQTEGLLASDAFTPEVIEEFRRIKRPLLANAFGKGAVKVERGNVIMVTSSVPGEGKSRVSLNLAHAIALERDHTVLLVDADVAKGQITRMYGLERARGLVDVLQHRNVVLEQVIAETDVSGLSVLPAGQRSSYATELLASNEMERLVLQLIEQAPARVVVFDSPPLLVTNEPQSLARAVGQIVVVVEASRTPQHLVKEAIGMLDRAKAIGLVLNKSRHSLGGDYYGTYYGYYGSGGEPPSDTRRPGRPSR